MADPRSQPDTGDDRSASEAAVAFCVGAAREYLRGLGAVRGGPGDRAEPRGREPEAAIADPDLARSAAGALRRLAALGCDDLLDEYLNPDPTSGAAPTYVVLRYEIGNTEPVLTEVHHSPATAMAALDEEHRGADAQELTVVAPTGTSWVPLRRVGGLVEFAGLPFVEMAGPSDVIDRATRRWEGILRGWARRHGVAGVEHLPAGSADGAAPDPAVLAEAVSTAVRAELAPLVEAMDRVVGRLDDVVRRLDVVAESSAQRGPTDADRRWPELGTSPRTGSGDVEHSRRRPAVRRRGARRR